MKKTLFCGCFFLSTLTGYAQTDILNPEHYPFWAGTIGRLEDIKNVEIITITLEYEDICSLPIGDTPWGLIFKADTDAPAREFRCCLELYTWPPPTDVYIHHCKDADGFVLPGQEFQLLQHPLPIR